MIYVIVGIVLFLLVFFTFMSRRMKVPRQVSHEGIEKDEVIEAYNRISQWPQFRILRKIISGELKKLRPEGILTDIGCGPGYLIGNMAKSFPHLSIIGVDITEEMLTKARENLSPVDLSNKVSFRQGDIRELPFESNSIDFAVSTLSLHHWSQPTQAIEEIYRVLKPNGQLLIFDLRRDSPRLVYFVMRVAQSLVLPKALGQINEPTASFLASYMSEELIANMSCTSFEEWSVKSGIFWTFILGRKANAG